MSRTKTVFNIRKSSGEEERFSSEKLKHSLLKSGASEAVVNQVLNRLKEKIVEGMPTSRIYRIALE